MGEFLPCPAISSQVSGGTVGVFADLRRTGNINEVNKRKGIPDRKNSPSQGSRARDDQESILNSFFF